MVICPYLLIVMIPQAQGSAPLPGFAVTKPQEQGTAVLTGHEGLRHGQQGTVTYADGGEYNMRVMVKRPRTG